MLIKLIKNSLFFVIFFINTLILTFLILVCCVIKQNIAFVIIRYWGKINLFCLKLIIKLKVEFVFDKNYKNLPLNTSLIASQHQSILDIIALCSIVKQPIFIFKESLLRIPLFGFALNKLNMISINRQKSNTNWLKQAENAINNNKNLIIFPEGTRANFGQKIEYKQGLFKIADYTKQTITPIALDTGKFWPKKGLIQAGISKIIIGAPINADAVKLREIYKKLLAENGIQS